MYGDVGGSRVWTGLDRGGDRAMRLSWRDVLERLQAQTDPNEPPVEAMGEESIGNSRDHSFN